MKPPPSLGTPRHLWFPSLSCIFNFFNCSFPQALKRAQVSAVFQTLSWPGLPLHFPVLKVPPLLIFSLSIAPVHTLNPPPYECPFTHHSTGTALSKVTKMLLLPHPTDNFQPCITWSYCSTRLLTILSLEMCLWDIMLSWFSSYLLTAPRSPPSNELALLSNQLPMSKARFSCYILYSPLPSISFKSPITAF